MSPVPAPLSSEEIAEIRRTFEFDEDVKSQVIMRLVSEVCRLRDAVMELAIDRYLKDNA